jgi:hypothetical protein
MDRRLPRLTSTPSSLSSSSSSPSINTPLTTAGQPTAGGSPWSPREPSPSLNTLTSWSSVTTPPTLSNEHRLVPSTPTPQDDRLGLLLDQMTTLTQLVASLISRIPPPPPPPDQK